MPFDLLVEERVLHMPLDARVAPDPELAQPACALVGVERAEQELLVARRRGVDDATALEAEAHTRDLVAEVAGRILRVADRAFGRVLDRRIEDLPARHVRPQRIHLSLAPLQAEGQVGVGADDPHLGRSVEVLGDPRHRAPESLPVDEHGAVQEVLERRQRHPRILGDGRGRVVAADPGLLVAQVRLVVAAHRLLARAEPFARHVRAVAGVLRRDHRHVRVRTRDLVGLDRGEVAEELERRLAQEHAADRVEAQPDERACTATGELAGDLLDERPPQRLRANEHLPARLGLDAVDEHPRVCLHPRIHRADDRRSKLTITGLDYILSKTAELEE